MSRFRPLIPEDNQPSVLASLANYLEWPTRFLLEHIEYTQDLYDDEPNLRLGMDILAARTAFIIRN